MSSDRVQRAVATVSDCVSSAVSKAAEELRHFGVRKEDLAEALAELRLDVPAMLLAALGPAEPVVEGEPPEPTCACPCHDNPHVLHIVPCCDRF